jgi:capsular polysaccharide biosynthesis protein
VVRLPARLRPLFPYLKPAYVQATRMLAPTTQAVSRWRHGQLPTGVVATLDEAASTSGGRCVIARPAERVTRPPMTGLPPAMPLTDTSDGEYFPQVAVAELPGGRVLGPHRAIVTGQGDLVQEVSWYFGTTRPREHPLFWQPFTDAPLEVAGRLGVLATRGDANYYHFLMDVLPRVAVLAQAPDIAPPDRWYVPARTRFQRELLDLAGIGAEQRIDADEHPHVQAETLVVPAPPVMIERNPPWVVGYLRGLLLPPATQPQPPASPSSARRIYVTRGTAANNRAVRNESEVLALLIEREFESVDPGAMSVRDQIATFAGASIIVSPHGAALANLVFASAGSTVIELFPPGVLLPDYWRLASGVPGLRYRYLSATVPGRPPSRASAIVRDIHVDIAALRALLDEAESSGVTDASGALGSAP